MLIFIKLGGSVITDKSKPFTPRLDIIKRLCSEIKDSKADHKIIIGHGGGSFPHQPAKQYKTNEGVIDNSSYKGIAEVQDAASRLNRIVVRNLIDAGLNAVSISPSSACIADNNKIVEWYTEPIKKLLDKDMIPVVYGDVVLDSSKGCSIVSTEKILNYISDEFKPDKIIVCGNVDGVLVDGKVVPLITKNNFNEIKKYLGGSYGTDVTGGMLNKVEELLDLASRGYKSVIINVNVENNLSKTINGQNTGTRIE